jgi:hypothetical protein
MKAKIKEEKLKYIKNFFYTIYFSKKRNLLNSL